MSRFIIGLDFGTESARGVLLDVASGEQMDHHVHPYRHGVMTKALPNGTPLGRGWALQNAVDYLEAAEEILKKLGQGRSIASIGIDFTASSPLPCDLSGEPLSTRWPNEPHAYVKLWKHGAAQPFADAINSKGGAFLSNFGAKLSGEWLLPKAAQIEAEAPGLWKASERFIEAGDWLVWQLTGQESRSLGFAAFKAQFSQTGYPSHLVPGLADKLTPPLRIGTAAGALSESWRARTGILGDAMVAVAVIDSHAVLPAIGSVSGGCLTAALGTSAAYLYLSEAFQPLPKGIEGMAFDASLPGMWCYEAGQASFGDMLAWFVRSFPHGDTAAESFRNYGEEASALPPGSNHLVALDWWNGNRVPLADSGLSGVLVGLTMDTSPAAIYRALIESICFGARQIIDLFEAGGLPIDRIVLTSGLVEKNALLLEVMTDVLGRPVEVPMIAHATAVGSAIHGAVAGRVVQDFAEGTKRFGAKDVLRREPRRENVSAYDKLYAAYRTLADDVTLREAMRRLNDLKP